MTIIGISHVAFTPKDGGTPVKGSSIFASYPLENGPGVGAEKFFLSSAKLAGLGFVPAVGDEVTILYNKYGKVETLTRNLNGGELID